MIENVQNKNVYVYCLADVVTGGCELLHQLVDYLNNNGRNAYIVYVGNKKHEIPEAYSKYNIKVASKVEDTNKSIVVIDEGFLYLASKIKYADCIFWWLSVDNFFLDPEQLPYQHFMNIYKWDKNALFEAFKSIVYKKMLLKVLFTKKFTLKDLVNKGAINAYQSEYARQFLTNFKFNNIVPLKDYINTDFVQKKSMTIKEKIVIYNPKKGWNYTKKLLEYKDINWIPLVNLTRKQMQETMQKAMVYIDFGNHPGKDRIPREAALNKCCIITGRRGSANNDIDIEIPSFYKIDEKTTPIGEVVNRINYVLDNYNQCILEQTKYVENIMMEKEEFELQVRNLFNITR